MQLEKNFLNNSYFTHRSFILRVHKDLDPVIKSKKYQSTNCNRTPYVAEKHTIYVKSSVIFQMGQKSKFSSEDFEIQNQINKQSMYFVDTTRLLYNPK